MRSRAFARMRPCGAFMVSRMCGSCGLIGAQKNGGQVGYGWYDQRVRQVRDLSSAGYRIVLGL